MSIEQEDHIRLRRQARYPCRVGAAHSLYLLLTRAEFWSIIVFRSSNTTMAVGSGVERFLDTEEVIGSNPIPPIPFSIKKFLTHSSEELLVFYP